MSDIAGPDSRGMAEAGDRGLTEVISDPSSPRDPGGQGGGGRPNRIPKAGSLASPAARTLSATCRPSRSSSALSLHALCPPSLRGSDSHITPLPDAWGSIHRRVVARAGDLH